MSRQPKWYSFRWQTGLAIVVVLAVLGSIGWYELLGKYRHPIGSGPAGPSVDARHFGHVWSTGKFMLIGIGDSITAGYGSEDGCGYFGLLAENDDSRFPELKGCDLSHVLPNLGQDNRSMSYTVSEEHLRDQVPGVKTYPSDVRGIVVMTSGGNDLIHDYGQSAPRDGAMYGCTREQAEKWKESYRARLREIIEGINGKFPGGCEIFLANIYDPTDGVGDIQNAHLMLPRWTDGIKALAMFNQVIAETCEEYPNVHLVDIHREFLGHGIHCSDRLNPHYDRDDPHYWYFENLEDPNDRGYDAIRRVFLLEMVEVLAPEEQVDQYPVLLYSACSRSLKSGPPSRLWLM